MADDKWTAFRGGGTRSWNCGHRELVQERPSPEKSSHIGLILAVGEVYINFSAVVVYISLHCGTSLCNGNISEVYDEQFTNNVNCSQGLGKLIDPQLYFALCSDLGNMGLLVHGDIIIPRTEPLEGRFSNEWAHYTSRSL